MQLQIVMVQSSRPWFSKVAHAPRCRDRASLTMHLEAIMEQFEFALRACNWVNWGTQLDTYIDQVQRCTLRPRSSKLRDALGGRNVQTCMPWSCELGGALGGCDPGSVEMHFEATIEQVQRLPWWPWLSKNGDAPEAMIDQVWWCTFIVVMVRNSICTYRWLIWRQYIGRVVQWEMRLHWSVN